ncbi:hypothetical protein BKA93DRAFT_757194 [Sparassis latifolia]
MAELLGQEEFTVKQMGMAYIFAHSAFELKNEKKGLVQEITLLRQQVATLEKDHQITLLRQQVATLEKDHHTSTSPVADNKEILDLRNQLQQVSDTVARKQLENDNLKQKCQANTQELQAEISCLRSQLEGQDAELQRSKSQAELLDQRLVEVEREKKAAEVKVEEARQESSREQDKASAQLQEMTLELQQLSEVIQKQVNYIDSLQRKAAEHSQVEHKDQGTQVEVRYRSIGIGVQSQEVDPTARRVRLSTAAKASGSSLSAPKQAGRGTANDGEPVRLTAHASPIPPHRLDVLRSLPTVHVELPAGVPNMKFSRKDLVDIIGGTIYSLIVRVVGSATSFAHDWDIGEYLCPNMEHNPWAPTGPGSHGFMQVGLGREKDAFNEPEIRHVFVGAKSQYYYCGKYEVVRVERLTVAEWQTLPEHVKKQYSVTTGNKEKAQKHGTHSQIRAKYDSGDLLAPCVLLRCIEFDLKFYDALRAAYAHLNKPRTVSSVSASTSISAGAKRRRDEKPSDESEHSDEDTHIKKPRIAHIENSARRQSIRISLRRASGKVHVYDESSDDELDSA